MLLNNQWIKQEIKQEIKNYFETTDNENTTFQNLWDAVLRRKFTIQAYLKKQEKSQINNLAPLVKELDKRTNKTQSKEKEGNS